MKRASRLAAPPIAMLALLLSLAAAPALVQADPFGDGLAAYQAGRYESAYRIWLPLAEAGDIDAAYNVARLYQAGQGVAQDPAAAAHWYRLAAERGHAWAQYNLGSLYRNGDGVPRNNGEAAYWYGLAAAQGDADAQDNLAFMYLTGEGVIRNDQLAAYWYECAAKQGNIDAQYNLGFLHALGQGVPRDPEAAYFWFSIAAANGHPDGDRGKEEMTSDLTDSEIARAKDRVAAWLAKHDDG